MPRLRPATDGDRAAIAAVWRAVAPAYAHVLPGAFEQEARAVELHGLSRRYDTWLVIEAGEPVGFAGTARLAPDVLYLAQLYLLPAWQRRGIGAAVLRQLERDVPPGGQLVLHVHEQAPWARAFYERSGYGLLADEAGSRIWRGGLLAHWTPAGTLLLGRSRDR